MKLALAPVLATLAGVAPSPAAATSCRLTVEWDGRTYVDGGRAERSHLGKPLGKGLVPACDRGEGDDDRPVRVYAIPGVPPSHAIVADAMLLVADGYLLPLPQHPAHDLVYASATQPDERHNCAPGSREVVGSLRESSTSALLVGDLDPIFVDARTRVPGLPRLNKGDRVRVDVLRCEGEGPGRRQLVAAEVELLEEVPPRGDRRGGIDRDVILGAVLAATILAAGFAVRILWPAVRPSR